MADTSKAAYKVAAAIGGAVPATFMSYGAHGATEPASKPSYTHGTSGAQSTILPKAMTVMDTYTKGEIDAKLALSAEKAGRANDGVNGKLDRLFDAVAAIGKDLTDFKREAKDDAAALRTEVRDDYKNTRHTLIGVAVGAIGIVIAIVALAYNMAGNMTTANGNVLAAVGAGRDAAPTSPPEVAAAPPPKFDAQTGKPIAYAGR